MNAMRMAYLILAHDAPDQLEALIERLAPPGSSDLAIVHADKGSALWPRLQAAWRNDSPNRKLIRDPVAVRWGHWTMVAAMNRLIEAARDANCDYVHLLSGADWLVCSREMMVREIKSAPGRCYLEAVPGDREERMQCRRLDTRWLRLDPQRDRLGYALCWELRRLSRWLDAGLGAAGFHRDRPYGPWCKGSQWWSLPREAIAVLADELPRVLASGRLRGTLCSDEHVVQTIVADRFPDRLAPNRRFIDWSEEISSPRLLDRHDSDAILASGAWFARKVSLRHDPFFLDLLPQESLVTA